VRGVRTDDQQRAVQRKNYRRNQASRTEVRKQSAVRNPIQVTAIFISNRNQGSIRGDIDLGVRRAVVVKVELFLKQDGRLAG
jgi:hypothetical protein